MKAILDHWQTSLAGVLVVALTGLSYVGVAVPGFSVPSGGLGAALTIGIGLILAKDANGKA